MTVTATVTGPLHPIGKLSGAYPTPRSMRPHRAQTSHRTHLHEMRSNRVYVRAANGGAGKKLPLVAIFDLFASVNSVEQQ